MDHKRLIKLLLLTGCDCDYKSRLKKKFRPSSITSSLHKKGSFLLKFDNLDGIIITFIFILDNGKSFKKYFLPQTCEFICRYINFTFL